VLTGHADVRVGLSRLPAEEAEVWSRRLRADDLATLVRAVLGRPEHGAGR